MTGSQTIDLNTITIVTVGGQDKLAAMQIIGILVNVNRDLRGKGKVMAK